MTAKRPDTQRTYRGILMLVVMAFIGFLLVYLPPQIVAQYRAVAELGDVWVYAYFITVGVGACCLTVATLWLVWRLWSRSRRKRERRRRSDSSPSQLTRQQQQQEIDENLTVVEGLSSDKTVPLELQAQLEPRLAQFEQKRESQTLEIVAFGTISSGKSSLLNALAGREIFPTDAKGGTTVRRNEIPWPGIDRVFLVDTPGLGEVDGAEHLAISAEAAKNADLVLLTVDGPLRESESALLKQLGGMEKRLLLCLNKQDWFDAASREQLLLQLREQAGAWVPRENVVAVQASPIQRPRVRVLPDGSEQEDTVEESPDISPLADRMLAIVQQEGESLLLANLLLQSRGLVENARQRVKESLDRRAWEIVDRYMWGAGGAAALSPFPLVDLVAGCAISSKMVVDLSQVYRQDMDLEAAVSLLGQLGKNLLSVMGASAATPAVTALVASLLKTVPGAGTIAGGLLQGIVQALITRWIGAVFIEYFRNEMQQPEGGLTGLARRQWDRMTQVDQLRKLVREAREHLSDDTVD